MFLETLMYKLHAGTPRPQVSDNLTSLEVEDTARSSKHAPSTPQLDPFLQHFLRKQPNSTYKSNNPLQDSGNSAADPLPDVPTEDWSSLEAHIQKDLNALQDPDAATRRRAMETISAIFAAASAPSASASSHSTMGDALEGSAGKALLRRFADPSERIREMAAARVADMLRACPDAALSTTPYLVPVLEERLIPLAVAPSADAELRKGPAHVDPSKARLEPSETGAGGQRRDDQACCWP